MMPTGTIEFIAGVDQELRFGPHPFEDVESFLRTQYAMVGSKSLDCGYGVALPKGVQSVE